MAPSAFRNSEFRTAIGITKINAGAIPLPVFFGTLGMRGMTAYFGLLDIDQPKPGEP
jgi:NADPH-dependent curcumin reductase CurA